METQARQNVKIETAQYQARIAQIQQLLDERELDGVMLFDPATLMWASGFHHIPNERPLALFIHSQRPPTLFVPFLEKENAAASWIQDVRWYWEFPGKIPPEIWMLQQIDAQRAATGSGVTNRIALDSVNHTIFEQMQAVKPDLRVEGGIGRLRYVKSAAELELMGLAAAYADYGLEVARQSVMDGLGSGITEVDVVQAV